MDVPVPCPTSIENGFYARWTRKASTLDNSAFEDPHAHDLAADGAQPDAPRFLSSGARRPAGRAGVACPSRDGAIAGARRKDDRRKENGSEEHTSELQSPLNLV